ncbi:MAG TPA: signal peptidase I [Conexibacter sp.]|nr:signal peptidase I [Conexibacter sp.]
MSCATPPPPPRPRALAWANRGATVALAAALALLALGVTLRLAGLTPLLARSASMAPAIAAGDVVLARDATAADLRAGEIATIRDPLSGRLITHRVVSARRDGDRVTVVTRGDANASSERWVLRAEAPVGRIAGRIPLLGRLLLPLGALAGTFSDFTATTTNAGNTFAAAAVNAAPDVSAAVVGKSAGGVVGYVKRSGTFFVYANASDDTAVASMRATLTNVTGSSTAVTLTAGSFSAGGVSYGYRSAQLTASGSLSNGAKSFTVTATDGAGLTDAFTGSVTADKDPPSASSVATANKAGGTAGRAEQGDSATITFNEAIEPDTILDGWSGAATDVQAAIIDSGGSANDVLRVYDGSALDAAQYLPVGTIDLGRSDFVTSGSYAVFGLASAGGTSSKLTLSGRTLTIVLGSLDYGSVSTSGANTTERYTPVATLTDLAGNAASTSTVSASGSHKAF